MSSPDNTPLGDKESLIFERTDSPPPDWEELLSSDPNADYFHTSHWTCCARNHHQGMEAYWLTARSNGRLVGGLAGIKKSKPLTRWESNLEGTSGGPLVDASLPQDWVHLIFKKLVDDFLGLQPSGLGTSCLTLNHAQEENFGRFLVESDAPWQPTEIPAAVISLQGGQSSLEKKLIKNKRNERNRGLRRDALIKITNDPDLLAAYYPLYEKASERWNVPPTPLPFLQALLGDQNLTEQGMTRTFFTCVILDGQVIGGHLNLQFKDRVIAWNGVTDPTYSRTHFPATLAVWGDLEESCRRGARFLDLGGSGGVVSLEGFKKSFGAFSEARGHYVLESKGMKILRSGKKILQGLRSSSDGEAPRRWHDEDPKTKSKA